MLKNNGFRDAAKMRQPLTREEVKRCIRGIALRGKAAVPSIGSEEPRMCRVIRLVISFPKFVEAERGRPSSVTKRWGPRSKEELNNVTTSPGLAKG